MQQLEIKFFWPLTEQVPLDLDYSPCENYWKNISVSNNINSQTLTLGTGWGNIATVSNIEPNSFHIRNEPDSVGYWEISEGMRVYRKDKPKYYIRYLTRMLLGWAWKDTK